MIQRRGDWIQTYSGKQFWPLDPRAEEIDILDIAHSLALQCRFAGHCREPYSVAEHCVRVSMALDSHVDTLGARRRLLALTGLLHDATEAYLVDLPRPIKRQMSNYVEIEEVLEQAIARRFGLVWPWESLVKYADNTLLATEARDLMSAPPVPWVAMPDPLSDVIVPWPWQVAKQTFLDRFVELGGEVPRG